MFNSGDKRGHCERFKVTLFLYKSFPSQFILSYLLPNVDCLLHRYIYIDIKGPYYTQDSEWHLLCVNVSLTTFSWLKAFDLAHKWRQTWTRHSCRRLSVITNWVRFSLAVPLTQQVSYTVNPCLNPVTYVFYWLRRTWTVVPRVSWWTMADEGFQRVETCPAM